MDDMKLPEGWEVKKLGELCEAITKGTTPTSIGHKFVSEGINFIKVESISEDGKFIHKKFAHITEEGNLVLKRSQLKRNDILFSIAGALGRTAIVIDEILPANTNQALAIIRLKNNFSISKEYILSALTSGFTLDQVERLKGGVAQQNLSLTQLKGFELPLPPLPEQKRIVSILDKAFAEIEKAKSNAQQNLKNAKELFESYLQGVFWNRGEGWEEKTLSDLCYIKHGFAFKSQFFSSEGEFVLLTPGNFYETGGFRNRGDKQKYYTGEFPRDYILKKGDLLVAMTEQAAGLLGSPILVPDSNKFLHNQRLGLIIPKKDISWSNEFFFHFFNTRNLRKILHNTGTGVKVRHTSPTKIGDVLVSFPSSINEQQKIINKLGALSAGIKKMEDIYQKKLSDLEELKKSILQKAFRGEL